MAIGHFLSGGTSNIEGGANNSRGIISLLVHLDLNVSERGDLSRRQRLIDRGALLDANI